MTRMRDRQLLHGSAAFAQGVRALPGHSIIELRLETPASLIPGLETLVSSLGQRGLGPTAIVGIDLRSPSALSKAQFASFNDDYQSILTHLGLMDSDLSPVCRTNAVPRDRELCGVEVVAAQVIAPSPKGSGRDFVISGAAELREDGTIVAEGADTPQALRDKVTFILEVIRGRLDSLRAARPNHVNVYFTGEIGSLLSQISDALFFERGAAVSHWDCLPPIEGLAVEVDCRRLSAVEWINA